MFDKYTNRKLSAAEVHDLIAPCTVEINAIGDTFESTGTGSFIDDKGTVITNYHVIESCHTILIKTQDGMTYEVESILGFDKDRDLAIIKTDYKNKNFVKFKTEKIRTGEKVYTLGSSLGLTGTFSEGIISSESREIDGFEYIQITAPISHGNSGGPLVDEYGKVVGITTGAFTEGQNLNLAIPVSAVSKINRDNSCSVQEFYQISQGKVVAPGETETDDSIAGEYSPIDIGHFNSLEELNDATKRNPGDFIQSVILSIQGTIVRTTNDNIYLVHISGNSLIEKARLQQAIEEELTDIDSFKFHCRIHMIDDTKNRVLSGDQVIISGVYNHSTQTLSECTYKLIG